MSVGIAAEEDIKVLVENFRVNLSMYYKTTHDSETGSDIERKIKEGCLKLESELTDQWNKNLRKVELFVHRNLLDSRSSEVGDDESLSIELNDVTENVESLSKHNTELITLKSQLINECELGDALLNDLCANVFQVKRSMQAFETHDVPLNLTVDKFSKQASKLVEKRTMASDLCKEMSIFWEKYSLNSSLGDILTDDSIIEALSNHLTG